MGNYTQGWTQHMHKAILVKREYVLKVRKYVAMQIRHKQADHKSVIIIKLVLNSRDSRD